MPLSEQAQVELLCTIPGIQRRAAEVLIAETGGDMSKFATVGHLASWAGVCPGNDESTGKRRSGRTTNGPEVSRPGFAETGQLVSSSMMGEGVEEHRTACLASYSRAR